MTRVLSGSVGCPSKIIFLEFLMRQCAEVAYTSLVVILLFI